MAPANSYSSLRLKFEKSGQNRTFAWWLHSTKTTRMHFVAIFVSLTSNSSQKKKKKKKKKNTEENNLPQSILLFVVKCSCKCRVYIRNFIVVLLFLLRPFFLMFMFSFIKKKMLSFFFICPFLFQVLKSVISRQRMAREIRLHSLWTSREVISWASTRLQEFWRWRRSWIER